MNYLPACSGIYFAIEKSGQVTYIGQSINIRQRWRAHHVQGDLCDLGDLRSARSVRIAWLELSNAIDIERLERILIYHYKPRLNKLHTRQLKPLLPLPAKNEPNENNPVTRIDDDFISTAEAADELGLTRQRVLQLIDSGRLRASKFANVYMIRKSDLMALEDRKPGRPRKPTKTKRSK